MQNEKLYTRISYAIGLASLLLLAVGLLVPGLFVVGGIGLAIAGTTGTMIGASSEAAGPDDHRVPSVTEILTRIEPSRYPFTTFLDRLRSAGTSKQIKHIWPEASRYARTATLNGVTTPGSANSAKTITLNDNSGIQVNDVLKSPANATDGNLAYIVTDVDSGGTDITIWALPVSTGDQPYVMDNYGTVPAFADGETLYWVTTAKTEGDDASPPRAIQPVYEFNYIQTHDLVIEWSDHKQRSVNWAIQDVQRYRQDNLYEFRKNREAQFCFNPAPSKTTGANGKMRWTQAGMLHYLNRSLTLKAPSGVPTQSNIVDFVYGAFDDNGADSKILMGGSDFLQAVDKANSVEVRVERSEVIAGVRVMWLEGRKGRLGTVFSPTFDEQGYRANAMVLDLNHIVKRDYQPMELRQGNLKNTGAMTDADREQYIEKCTLEVRNKPAHRWCSLDTA